jgi:hypothetical protein
VGRPPVSRQLPMSSQQPQKALAAVRCSAPNPEPGRSLQDERRRVARTAESMKESFNVIPFKNQLKRFASFDRDIL